MNVYKKTEIIKLNFESSISQYDYNRDLTLFWTQYFLSLFDAYHKIAPDNRKIMCPLVSAVYNISYLLSEQNLFWEELEWYVRETHVWIPDLLFSDHVTLEELCKLFKLWFSLFAKWGWWFLQLLWISWGWLEYNVCMVPGIYSIRGWLLYSVWSGPIITLFKFRYFYMHLCMLSNPKRNQFT